MKNLLPALVAAALFVSPLAVRADQPGGPPEQPANPAAVQAMQQAHAKMEQLHSQARIAMLNTLSPAQRATLAQVVGQLAVAPSPDQAAAAKQIDASLTQAQARNILSISASLHQQAHQLMQSVHQQMMSAMPSGGAAHSQSGMNGVHPGNEQGESDAGMILLKMATHASEHGEFHHMG
jgi:hypothetical protein